LVMRMQHRSWAWRALCVWMLAVAFGALPVQAAERLAQGLIVKLKDSAPVSLVRHRAMLIPQGTPAQWRMRMAAAGQRSRVSFITQRPTAFGAMVLTKGYYTSVTDAELEAARLRADPEVEWVLVNEMHQPAAFEATDPLNAEQGWLGSPTSNSGLGQPNLPAAFSSMEAWLQADFRRQLKPVVVAVLDTGVLPHPDMAGRVFTPGSAGYDFVSEPILSNDGGGPDANATDPGDYVTEAFLSANRTGLARLCGTAPTTSDSSWHGTATAGILAAGHNGMGLTGVLAPLAGPVVLPVRISGVCGAALSDIIEGMLWSAGVSYSGSPASNPHPARVINLSFGSAERGCDCTDAQLARGDSSVACMYRHTINALTAKGALLVASAGNGASSLVGRSGYGKPSMPAACPGALAVTSVRQTDARKASYANVTPVSAGYFALSVVGGDSDAGMVTTGNAGYTTAEPYALMPPDLVDYSLYPRSDYVSTGGTSMSAPIAAGVAALMLAVKPDLSVGELLLGLTQYGVRPHAAVSNSDTNRCSATTGELGVCKCTTSTCGSGVLDADLAVQWAMSFTPADLSRAQKYANERVSASFFLPDRATGSGSSSRASGGGGGLDLGTLLFFGLAALLITCQLKAGKPQTPCLRAGAGH
jgi:serine protease